MVSERLETERLVLEPLAREHAAAILAYYDRNRLHLEPWEPARDPLFYTLTYWQNVLPLLIAETETGNSARFLAFERGGPREVVAAVNVFNIQRGSFGAGTIGYSVDGARQGRGFGREAVAAVVKYAFDQLALHRVMANYQPNNERSGRLLRGLGFVVEGYARDYLYLNGAWRDHILTAKVRTPPGEPLYG